MARGNEAAKSQAKNLAAAKAAGQSPEERAAAKKKADGDKNANLCLGCRQTFLISATDALLYGHVAAKHPKDVATPEVYFARLKGFDPNAPVVEKKTGKTEKRTKKVEKLKQGTGDLSALLSEGLSVGGKKKKK